MQIKILSIFCLMSNITALPEKEEQAAQTEDVQATQRKLNSSIEGLESDLLRLEYKLKLLAQAQRKDLSMINPRAIEIDILVLLLRIHSKIKPIGALLEQSDSIALAKINHARKVYDQANNMIKEYYHLIKLYIELEKQWK